MFLFFGYLLSSYVCASPFHLLFRRVPPDFAFCGSIFFSGALYVPQKAGVSRERGKEMAERNEVYDPKRRRKKEITKTKEGERVCREAVARGEEGGWTESRASECRLMQCSCVRRVITRRLRGGLSNAAGFFQGRCWLGITTLPSPRTIKKRKEAEKPSDGLGR